MGSEVRQAVTHLISFDFLPPMGAGRKRALRRYAISLGVRRISGVSKLSGAEGLQMEVLART